MNNNNILGKLFEIECEYNNYKLAHEEALSLARPLIKEYNIKAKLIANKYNMKPKLISLKRFNFGKQR